MFHGGAAGLAVGDVLLPAAELRSVYAYLDPMATYDPELVYFTTDVDVARSYAGRYVNPAGAVQPGDLYRVCPLGPVRIDPDYSRHGEFRGVFLACEKAEIVEVVDRGLLYTEEEQIRLERRYLVWGRPDRPIYDDDGWIIPSDQMLRNGVTREWTTMLRPWLRTTDVDAKGRLSGAQRSANPWAALLDVIPSLDGEHQIALSDGELTCLKCAAVFETLVRAARHQLGDRQMELLARIHEWPKPPTPTVAAEAARRRPERWAWLDDAEGWWNYSEPERQGFRDEMTACDS